MREYIELIDAPLEEVIAQAKKLRLLRSENKVHVCAIINAKSGNCPNDCAFCAQSIRHAGSSPVYALLDDEKLEGNIAHLEHVMPGNIGLVCSGSALAGKEFERLCNFIACLDEDRRARICLSAGTLGRDSLCHLKEAGLRHYHHNLESNERFYKRICTTQKWRLRWQTVWNALEAGFEVCCGALFGLGESWLDRIELALELKDMGINNVPLNFLTPRPGTAMADRPMLGPEEVLRIIAIFRMILPEAILRICGGRKQCLGKMQQRMFDAGGNAIITGNYLTAPGAGFEEDCALLEACDMRFVENMS